MRYISCGRLWHAGLRSQPIVLQAAEIRHTLLISYSEQPLNWTGGKAMIDAAALAVYAERAVGLRRKSMEEHDA
jgi:hypothetical protein